VQVSQFLANGSDRKAATFDALATIVLGIQRVKNAEVNMFTALVAVQRSTTPSARPAPPHGARVGCGPESRSRHRLTSCRGTDSRETTGQRDDRRRRRSDDLACHDHDDA
jgi:hypothetical protein